MVLFTDIVPSKDTQAEYGWTMILVITLNTCINMGLVLCVGFKGVYYVTAKYVLLAGFWGKKLCLRIAGPVGAGFDKFVAGPFQKLKGWWDGRLVG